jgi:PPP family 3-phenylpropionic acid transporter
VTSSAADGEEHADGVSASRAFRDVVISPRKMAQSWSRHGSALSSFVVLYALLYASFGVSSPFMPRFFESRGLSPEWIGLLFGLGTAARLLSGPVAGRVADLLGAVRAVLALCMLAAAGVALGLVNVGRLWALVGVGILHAALLAPTTTLADALSVSAARSRRFEYGWVRGSASGAFVAGSLVAGQVLRFYRLDAIVWMHAALLLGAGFAVRIVPPLDVDRAGETPEERSPVGGVVALLALAPYRRLLGVAALVLGSHAMHDSFAMVRWNAAGIGPGSGSLLWSESVAAEVVMFFVVGPWLIGRLAPGGAMALAAVAGVVRWIVMSFTTSVAVLSLVQPLHGFTFALLHLACMRSIGAIVSPHLAATAQSLYAVGATAVTAFLMAVSGVLYAHLGARGFLVMACLCAVAVPLARGLEVDGARDDGVSRRGVRAPSGSQQPPR